MKKYRVIIDFTTDKKVSYSHLMVLFKDLVYMYVGGKVEMIGFKEIKEKKK